MSEQNYNENPMEEQHTQVFEPVSSEQIDAQQPTKPQQPVQPQQPQQPVQSAGTWQPENNPYRPGTGDPARQLPYNYRGGMNLNQPQPGSDGAYRYSGDPQGNRGDYYDNPGYQTARPGAYSAPQGDAGYRREEPGSPMSGYNVKTAETPKKKKGVGKGVIAAAIIFAILGGIGGGTAVGLAMRRNPAVTAELQEETAQAEAPENNQQTAQVPADSSDTASAKEEPASTIESGEKSSVNTTVIEVTTNSDTTEMTPQDVYQHYVNAVVAVYNEATVNYYGQSATSTSSGSGFIISEDGYIITNNHVVAGAESLKVTMTSGEEYEATLIGTDADNDVALIKIEASGLPTVSIGDSDAISVGEQVAAIGNPLGTLTNTLTVGYVSALDREITENGTPINMFQTDCVINSGNSGGPIFDMHGNVIGITTAKYSSGGSFYEASIEGIGFCIPINDAMSVVNDLLDYGYVRGRAYMGITCQAVDASVIQNYGLPEGIAVATVEEGSAAEKAGLQQGDIITAVDGTEVSGMTEFRTMLKNYSAGDQAVLSVYRSRSGENFEVTITFDEKNSKT